jgi:hypothetical protein
VSQVEENKQSEHRRRFRNIDPTINGQHHRLDVATTWTLNDVAAGAKPLSKFISRFSQSATERREIHMAHQLAA